MDIRKAHFVVVTRDLAVQVEDHADLLHGLEDGVEDLVVLDASLGARGDASRVALDALDPLGCGELDLVRRDGRVEVEREQELGVGAQGAQVGAVRECSLGRRDGRTEVGLRKRGEVDLDQSWPTVWP